jgi:hypothetical protein
MSRKVGLLLGGLFILGAMLMASAPGALAQDCASGVAKTGFAVTPPPASAGAAAAFSGNWAGSWEIPIGIRKSERHNATLCAQLHVSVKSPQSAAVAYCFSSLPEGNIAANCTLADATISGNQLTFTTAAGYVYTFTAGGTGLQGQYISKARQGETAAYNGDFHKI